MARHRCRDLFAGISQQKEGLAVTGVALKVLQEQRAQAAFHTIYLQHNSQLLVGPFLLHARELPSISFKGGRLPCR